MSYQPTNVIGLRVPLFDRLVDSAPDQPKEVSPLRVYTKQSLFESVTCCVQFTRYSWESRANEPREISIFDER